MSIPSKAIFQPVIQHAQALLDFIDASPSPSHVVATVANRLKAEGFIQLAEQASWRIDASGKYFVVRAGSLIAFIVGKQAIVDSGFKLVGAHTDSPGLRLKVKAGFATQGIAQLGVEVYGSPILATFTDRDLSLAGRVTVREKNGFNSQLVRFTQPMVRLPNLAIHMNREVNEKGLLLNKQTGLPLIFGYASDSTQAHNLLTEALAQRLNTQAEAILTWDLNVYDTQTGCLWGPNQEFIANSQLDNLSSCHAGIEALLAFDQPNATCICALFDHEEVGSESAVGAGSSLLPDLLMRICVATNTSVEQRLQGLSNSLFISVDTAHAFHPNHIGSYEPCHHVMVNQGPVIKNNVNQRYSTTAETTAQLIQLCERAQVPYQHYTHRSDLGCGSTIGPMLSALLGIASVDIGNAIWAMHSIRESGGVQDHHYMTEVLKQHFASV